MIKKLILISMLLNTLLFATNTNSPFLINNSGLPHLTKILIKNWNEPKLTLTKAQKKKLLIIRKETLKSVKKIKKQLKPLEDEIVVSMTYHENPTKLDNKIAQIAKLKVEATKIHLQCISKTLKVLNDKQVEFLLPFGDY